MLPFVPWGRLQGGPQAGLGLVPRPCSQKEAQIEIGRGVLGIGAQGPAQGVLRLHQIAPPGMDKGRVHQGQDHRWIELQGRLVVLQGPIQVIPGLEEVPRL